MNTIIESVEYVQRKTEITDGKIITYGIKFKFKRQNGTFYERIYEYSEGTFDIQSIREKLFNKFLLDLLVIYRIFIDEKTPEIKADSAEEFCKKYIKLFYPEQK